MTVETISSREAREKWRDVLDKILTGSADVVIERSGKPVAVLIPVEDYRELQDELDDVRAARRAAALYEEYQREPSTGLDWDEIRDELVKEGRLDV